MQSSYKKGKLGEDIAVRILQNLKYNILARRLRTPYGEIDILARTDNTVVAVEVKLRKSLAQARECIQRRQRNRICHALLFVMSERNITFENYRIDVICLDHAGSFEHIKNAFSDEAF